MDQIVFCRTAQSGNVFWILGMAKKILMKDGRKAEAIQMQERVCNSGSYEDALEIMSEYVELVEVDEQ